MYKLIDSYWLMVHGSWLMTQGSWLMAHRSRLIAHGQERRVGPEPAAQAPGPEPRPARLSWPCAIRQHP